MLHVLASVIAIVVATRTAINIVRPLFAAPRPPPLPTVEPPGIRFGLTDADRHAIFDEIAAAEPRAREIGASAFAGLPWSIEDHRCAQERETVKSIAARRGINLSLVYLVLDEGIREHWIGPDGKPLRATSEPLVPRRNRW